MERVNVMIIHLQLYHEVDDTQENIGAQQNLFFTKKTYFISLQIKTRYYCQGVRKHYSLQYYKHSMWEGMMQNVLKVTKS
jgi:hypothetical protein